MIVRKRVQDRWDVRMPECGKPKWQGRLKTALAGLVLLALVAGPILVSNGKKSGDERLGPKTTDAPVAQAAGTWNGEEEDRAKEGTNQADSTGAQHGRYFPGRQAM